MAKIISYIPDELLVYRRQDSADCTMGFIVPITRGAKFSNKKQQAKRLVGANSLPELTIKNDKKSGYTLLKFTSGARRYDNDSWCLFSPDGYDVYISANNMQHIIENCQINCGVIESELVWVVNEYEDKFLTTTETELYKESITVQEHTARVSLNDIKPGSKLLLKDGTECIFYGGIHLLPFNYISDIFNFKSDKKSTRFQIYKTKNYKGKMGFVKSTTIDVQTVLETNVMTEADCIKEAVEYYNSLDYDYGNGFVANPKPFKVKDVKIKYITSPSFKLKLFNSTANSYHTIAYYRDGYVIKNSNNEFVPIEAHTEYSYGYNRNRTITIGIPKQIQTTKFNGETVNYKTSNSKTDIGTVVADTTDLEVYQVRFHL